MNPWLSDAELRRLATLVFELTRKEVWLGGKGGRSNSDWPDHIPQNWSRGVYWTLSPEVVLGGHRVRVCVSSSDYHHIEHAKHTVRVFIDDDLKYPGGKFWRYNWPWLWSARIARYEREEGGKTSPVDTRADLIEEARERVHGGVSDHVKRLEDREPSPSPEALAAAREVERYVQRVGG